MSLEELLRSRVILRMKPDHRLTLGSIRHAYRDLDTAKTLIVNKQFDWSLAVSYNAMLGAGRALMFDKGYCLSASRGYLDDVVHLFSTVF